MANNGEKKYTIDFVSFTHGAKVVVEPHENSNRTTRKYQGCAGSICGAYAASSRNEASYFLVDLGEITIPCGASEITALGLRRVVQDQYAIHADGKR